jgi:glucoamylase
VKIYAYLKMFSVLLVLPLFNAYSQDAAFGRPGATSNWSSGKKVNVGTSAGKSKVWFTNAEGILTEVYFPAVDSPQIKDSQILVLDNNNRIIDEKKRMYHQVEVKSPSMVSFTNQDVKKRFTIEHDYFTLDNSHVLIDKVTVESFVDGLRFYLLVNPSLNGNGFSDNARTENQFIQFYEKNIRLNISSTIGFAKTSVGYVGTSDGYQDLKRNRKMQYRFKRALDGNVAGMGKLNVPAKKGRYTFYIVYDFEKQRAFTNEFLEQQRQVYHARWNEYFAGLKSPGNLKGDFKKMYYRSLYVMKVHEDKNQMGASVASLSKPWGEKLYDQKGVTPGGYHLVWPRDLFHVSLAQLYSGDKLSAYRALRFLKKIQYQSGQWNFDEKRVINKKGAFPQNVWTSGNEYWGGLQLDQVGYPVQLFYHLYLVSNKKERQQILKEFASMTKLALEFIYRYGPWSHQERWEENFGISPSSFAVATAALKMGSQIFNEKKYKDRANKWLFKPGDNIHTWTFTERGLYGDGKYYLRVAGCGGYNAPWRPNENQICTIANSGVRKSQLEILDQGFLKLALFGLVPAADGRILTSLQKVNSNIRTFVKGKYVGWNRYSFDAYGENKKGQLWPLLSSEHGRHYIELYREGKVNWERTKQYVDNILNSYLFFANDGGMIPEQVFANGEGTGAATPLSWSHAEFVKLLWSRYFARNIENVLER